MITEPDIHNEIEQADDPFVTASEIAEQYGVSRQTAHRHLQRMYEHGEIEKRKVGSSAVIWWRE